MQINVRGHKMNLSNILPLFVLTVIWAVVPTFVSSRLWLSVFVLVFIKATASVSLRTLGLSGNISFAHGSFMAVGAYTAAILANNLGVPAYITIPAGAVIAMLIGILTGFPFIRLRSLYFTMASMFLGLSIVYIVSALKVTGGQLGITHIPGLFSSIKAYYYFFFGLAVVSCAIMYRFEFSRIGITLRALAQSPEAATAMGVNEASLRILAVAVGCFFSGLAGSAYAHFNAMLSPNSFGLLSSLWLLMYIMIGGADKFIGPILGTIVFVILPEISRSMNQYSPFITAAVVVAIAYLLPGGLASMPNVIKQSVSNRRERRAIAVTKAEDE